jgi:hypothetical protein
LILDCYDKIKAKIEKANPNAVEETIKEAMTTELASDYVLASYLRLFAPACMGVNFSSLAGFALSLSRLILAISDFSITKNEMGKDSGVLKLLQAGTEAAHSEFPQISSLFTEPIFAVPDQIFTSESYQGEPLFWDEGYDHFGVCKPTYTHKRPLDFVRK